MSRAVEPVMSQMEIARHALKQAGAYVPRDEWGRHGRARNIAQIKAFIASGGDLEAFLEKPS